MTDCNNLVITECLCILHILFFIIYSRIVIFLNNMPILYQSWKGLLTVIQDSPSENHQFHFYRAKAHIKIILFSSHSHGIKSKPFSKKRYGKIWLSNVCFQSVHLNVSFSQILKTISVNILSFHTAVMQVFNSQS